MKIHSLLFVLGLVVVVMAFFDFPLPHFFDKWLLVLVGVLVSFFSYTLMNEKRTAETREGSQPNASHEKPVV